MQKAKIKVQKYRAKFKKFCILSCHFDFSPLTFNFVLISYAEVVKLL